MDEYERERRNHKAISLYFRVKHAILGSGMIFVGLAIAAWLLKHPEDADFEPGPWP